MRAPVAKPQSFNHHHEGGYSPEMMEWRRICAEDKARNLLALLANDANAVHTVLEVGCGTGAVLEAVRRRGIGRLHFGVDTADPADHRQDDSAPLNLVAYDGSRLPFSDGSMDLVFASHVLEHVTDVRGFLSELRRVARRFVYVEVPCELNARTSRARLVRTLAIGHINAYTPDALWLALETSGLDGAQLRLFDHSLAVYGHGKRRGAALVGSATRRGLLRLSPWLASRLLTYHCGALVEVRR